MSSVDVIIHCYRYGHYLRECVESVLNQSHSDLRVLIIDDASPDATAEVALQLQAQDRRISFLRHATNQGHIRTYNEGIDWTEGQYYLLLSADDYLVPGALRRAAQVLDAYPEAGFVFGEAWDLPEGEPGPAAGSTGERLEDVPHQILSGRAFIEYSGCWNRVPTPTAVIRTALQKRVGGYRVDLPHAGDMEMWLRLAAHGAVGRLECKQAVYRRHEQNMSRGYMSAVLPDLSQRKLAVDTLVDNCREVLPDARLLHRRLTGQLVRHAVGLASKAFNAGELERSGQIAGFAAAMNPSVTRSWPWFALQCKRRIGRRGSRLLTALGSAWRDGLLHPFADIRKS